MNTDSSSLEAVIAAAKATGSSDPNELLEQALAFATAAERLDYVRAVRATNETNLAQIFPDWAGNIWNVYTLKVTGVTRPSGLNSAGLEYNLDKARVMYERPPTWTQGSAEWVDTDWLDNGWQPRHIGRVAQKAAETGATCRWYWRRFSLDAERNARELVWLEIVSAGSGGPAQPARPAAAQAQAPQQAAAAAPQPQPTPAQPAAAPAQQRPEQAAVDATMAQIGLLNPNSHALVEQFIAANGIPPLVSPELTPLHLMALNAEIATRLGAQNEEPF